VGRRGARRAVTGLRASGWTVPIGMRLAVSRDVACLTTGEASSGPLGAVAGEVAGAVAGKA